MFPKVYCTKGANATNQAKECCSPNPWVDFSVSVNMNRSLSAKKPPYALSPFLGRPKIDKSGTSCPVCSCVVCLPAVPGRRRAADTGDERSGSGAGAGGRAGVRCGLWTGSGKAADDGLNPRDASGLTQARSDFFSGVCLCEYPPFFL